MGSRKTQKRPKYEQVLQLVGKKTIIAWKTCKEELPKISSTTFYSTMNKLSKSKLVKKFRLDKRRIAYRKTRKYSIEEARRIFEGRPKEPNPVLTMSIYSLLNALEFFQGRKERHRQATIILMDLAVEYVLKAKSYEANPVKFIEGQLEQADFFAALREVKKIKRISREDEVKITRVHKARNYVQHRARIPDSPSTRQYMVWVYEFIRRFISKNFAIDIASEIPASLLTKLKR